MPIWLPGNPVVNYFMSTHTNQATLPLAVTTHLDEASTGHRGNVVIQTHGCKLNQADSSVLARQFRQAGYRLVEEVAEADIVVLNTCTVTATADSKARQALRAARRSNPDAVVVAAGCYPQRAAQDLEQMPAVSLVVGNMEKDRLVSLAVAAHQRQLAHSPLPLSSPAGLNIDAIAEDVTGRLPGRSRAMVKIQEGCDQVCAYCIVPKVRGRERSIPPQEIVREVRRRVAEGCQEVTLTGTQLGTYGFDIPGENLRKLVDCTLRETGIARLRVSSLQPQEISEGFLQLWLDDSRLCPHFHVPLQSGCDRVLQSMRRRYSTEQFAETVNLIRQALPDAGITADLIVGFPGEGEAEFEESLAFANSMKFSDMHIFPYSRRPGTSAAYLEDQVPASVQKSRMAQALEMARRSFNNFRLSQLGSTRSVLWEGNGRANVHPAKMGLTDNYIRVAMLPSETEGNQGDLANVITQAELVEMAGKTVLARPM